MANLYSNRNIIKIPSSLLSKSKWNLKISVDKLNKENQLVGLASSYVVRTLDEIANTGYSEERLSELSREISKVARDITNKSNRTKIRQLHEEEFGLLYMPHIVCIHIDKIAHYDRLNKGFSIEMVNGKKSYGKFKYKRFLSTSASIKKGDVYYVDENYIDELLRRVNNDRIDKEFVPAKLSAYMALTMSSSNPVTNTPNVLVVNDVETTFTTSVLELDGSKQEEPIMKQIDDYEMTLNASDGFGFIDPNFAQVWANDLHLDYLPSGFVTRNAFCKGVLIPFEYKLFAHEVANNYIVKDVWGKEWDIRNVDIVLTTSMLKLSNSYNSWEHYYESCLKNGYTFSVTKQTPKVLDMERTTNYQFIQSLELSDEDIYNFIKPSIDDIKRIKGMDWKETLIYLRGTSLNEDSNVLRDDYSTALMIEKDILKDSYVQQSINNMIKKRIEDCKKGTINVRGNYQTVTIDPICLAQHMFGLEVKGFLKSGEFYSQFWNDLGVDFVIGFRAPQVSYNNISKFHLKNTSDMQKWYKHLGQLFILNAYDSTCSRMSGMDCDGDTVFTTDNPYIIKGTQRNALPIICLQNSSSKKYCTEEDFIESDKLLLRGEVDNVGVTTNRATSIQDVQSNFEYGSKEWLELDYRIQACIQKSQDSIDVAKGVKIEYGFPKHWISQKANEVRDDDNPEIVEQKLFNASIVADKKPYFFIYVYPHLRTEYNLLKQQENKRCLRRFNKTLEEVLKNPQSEEELDTIKYFNLKKPVEENPSLMNKIAWYVEKEFKNFKLDKIQSTEYVNLLKTERPYKKSIYNSILELYHEYMKSIKNFSAKNNIIKLDYIEKTSRRNNMMQELKQKALAICNNEEELCNIMVDICYANEKNSKYFAWSICGEQIIKNLLVKNDYKVSYPIYSNEETDLKYKGLSYKIHTKTIKEEK